MAEDLPGLEALEEGCPSELAARVRAARAAKLEADVAAMQRAAAGLPPGTPVRCAALEAAVRELAAREQRLGFHARLAAEVAERFGTCGAGEGAAGAMRSPNGGNSTGQLPYSLDNFAYGSTPYATWLKVLSAAGDAVEAAMATAGREYVVWGSSCGWLVLYGALTYGWRSRGVEILACLHETAVQVAAQLPAGGPPGSAAASFRCGDLLLDDVSGAGLVLLADQCWDPQLAAAAAAKLGRELLQGALCVSYSGAALETVMAPEVAEAGSVSGGEPREGMGGGADEVGSGGGKGRAFEEVAVVRAPVSWAEAQPFRVFRRL
ncbi:hypothetical protein GPECTOR_19g293 [Gonium pectorale]|uniref:Uncharacterized protein n=1 Tax=Gonium pectorale TaxID=33097 RepID=A0A150GJ56_GONPE|nr:hypothetical protein GPECTOR_19g293 [Gonium pectorale]|eukprot:KXZ49842.1 hypothetical protein GPECTOR_19g293 [Gonium pectorale]